MDLSTSMNYVMMRAQAEAAAAKSSKPSVECIFLGIFKLSELSAEEIAPTSRHKPEIDEDITVVKSELNNAGIDSSRSRALLRGVVARGIEEDEQALIRCLAEASASAASRGVGEIWAQDMLAAILKAPTGAMLQVLPLDQAAKGDIVQRERNS